jgi:small nuclear ribonucleoprotein (snRNP)-like protein
MVGILRSFDQFLNVVLEDTYDRVVVGGGRTLYVCVYRILLHPPTDGAARQANTPTSSLGTALFEEMTS